MKINYLRIHAAFLATLSMLCVCIRYQPVLAASEAKGLRGYVCDELGKPVPYPVVKVNLRNVESDANGRFFLPHEKLKAEKTALVTVEAEYANKERNPPLRWPVNYAGIFDIATGEESISVRPRMPTAISGTVLSTDGKPISEATVWAEINVGGLVCTGHLRIREPVKTDAGGRFRISNLYANNDYLLRVEANAYERKWTGWIHARSGQQEPVEIRLRQAPAFIEGKVVDIQGNPISHTRVLIGHLCCPDAKTETDANGSFRIGSFLADQEVEVWSEGTTVKARTGTNSLRIVAKKSSQKR